MSLNFSYIFQLGTDEVLQSVGATCPKLVYLKFQLRIQVNNTGHYERICVTEKGILALLNCQELKTIKVGIKLEYPGRHLLEFFIRLKYINQKSVKKACLKINQYPKQYV